MQFKIKNTKISISFTFFALIIILISLNKTEFLYSTIDSDKVTHLKAPTLSETEIELLVQNIED